MALVKGRVFADRSPVPKFGAIVERLIIDCLIEECSSLCEVVAYAYEHLLSNSPILKAMIDSHCARFNVDSGYVQDEEVSHLDKLPWAFFMGVMLRYAIVEDVAKAELNVCDYHDCSEASVNKQDRMAAVHEMQADFIHLDKAPKGS